MFSVIGLDVAMLRNKVLQAWFHEEADVWRQVVLQTEAEGGRELPRSVERCLLADLIPSIHIIVGMEC